MTDGWTRRGRRAHSLIFSGGSRPRAPLVQARIIPDVRRRVSDVRRGVPGIDPRSPDNSGMENTLNHDLPYANAQEQRTLQIASHLNSLLLEIS